MARPTPISLRSHLRDATGAQHDELDHTLGPMGMLDGDGYACFLTVQYFARQNIETWLCSELSHGEAPPLQTPLIAADLADTSRGFACAVNDQPNAAFRPPANGAIIGALWVLAGSSLGNRFILSQRKKAGLAGPSRFLSDNAMPSYFRTLRKQLDQPTAQGVAEPAVAMARAVFSSFREAMQQYGLGEGQAEPAQS